MSDIVTALGPGRKLDSLASFAPDYVSVRRAFNDLLVFPHLEAIEIEDTSKTNLLSLVTDGNSRFSGLSNIDIGLARNVIAYDSAFSALVDAINIQLLVMTLQPVAQEYADHARAHSEANLKFYADFTDYINSVDGRIDSLDAVLAQLDAEIQAQSEALAGKNIVTTLWEVLKTLYKLASTAEDSDVQLAAILGVTISTISGSFKSLFDDQLRLQKIISSLKGFQTRTRDLKTRFLALSAGLKTVSISSKSLLDTWDDVAARMGTVIDDIDSVPAPEAQQLKNAWAKVTTHAKEYIDVLQRSSSDLPGTPSVRAVESYRVITAKFNAFPKIPITADEIRLYKLAAAHGHDSLCGPNHTTINSAASVYESSHSLRSRDDEKVVETVLGPPAGSQKKLKDLADSTGRVINQFNEVLRQPYLDQYKCLHPNGSDSNLLVVMDIYREKYLQLQLDTLPVARDLAAYAELQKTLLPLVVPDAQAQGDKLPMSVFLATNSPLVKEYLEKAQELSRRSTQVKNDWDKVVSTVNRLINECDDNIKNINASIDELTEQQKKASLYAFLAGIGAFLAFTAAVFLPGVGMLVALGIGAVLGGLAVWQIVEYAKLTIAINELKASLKNAENTRANLQALLPFVTGIAASLSSISLIWSDIATVLTSLDTFHKVLSGITGPALLETLKPIMIENWDKVQIAAQQYIQVVSRILYQESFAIFPESFKYMRGSLTYVL